MKLGLRELRISLGQTQEDIANRAKGAGKARDSFSRITVHYSETHGIGHGSDDTRSAMAAGLGLEVEDLDAFLDGRLSLQQAVGRSSLRPDPSVVAALQDAEQKRKARLALPASTSSRRSGQRFPNLAATLEWCAGQFPDDYLDDFERRAMRRRTDLSKGAWLDVIRAEWWQWTDGKSSQLVRTLGRGEGKGKGAGR